MTALLKVMRALLPRRCPGCDTQLGAEAGLCGSCRAALMPRIEWHSPMRPQPEPHLVTLGRYVGTTRRAVRALKYGGAQDLSGVLGSVLARGIPAAWGVASVVPVPLHTSRQRERGFNQSMLLAEVVAQHLSIPAVPAVRRIRATAQQAKLHATERGANLAGAFQADAGRLPRGPVLLLDDVMTSGSTLLACRDALNAAGVGAIYYAVVAR
ncbi:ComF family protein [Deinococcus oregonensis]|uniref:ComF family protein n=1 Tax=Deinococcus oregonensis TaxID=1805970 RepID=A0ABV6AX55_9DEIO